MVKRSEIDSLTLDEAREVQRWLLSRISKLEQMAIGPVPSPKAQSEPMRDQAERLIEDARSKAQARREGEASQPKFSDEVKLPTKDEAIAMFKGLFR